MNFDHLSFLNQCKLPLNQKNTLDFAIKQLAVKMST